MSTSVRPDAAVEPGRDRLIAQHALLLRGIANRLEGEFGDMLTRDTLQHYVEDSYTEMSSRAKVLTHIPAFVERFARQRLRSLAKGQGLISGHPVEVLFVCERNDAASQMAAVLFNSRVGDRAHGWSAGAQPAEDLRDEAVHVLHEIGLDLLGAFPKPITAEVEQAADVIVTLDAHDDIVLLDDKQYRAWRLPDRHDGGLDGYRQLREDISDLVDALIGEVVPAAQIPTHRAFDEDIDALERHVSDMGAATIDLGRRLTAAFEDLDGADLAGIVAGDDAIDQADRDTAQMVMEFIARRQPVAGDLRRGLAMSQTSLHLERIADCIVDTATILGETPGAATSISDELRQMAGLVPELTADAMRALSERSADLAHEVDDQSRRLNRLGREAFVQLIEAKTNGMDRLTLVNLDRMARLLKRAGDHAVEIAEETLFLVTGETHDLGRSG